MFIITLLALLTICRYDGEVVLAARPKARAVSEARNKPNAEARYIARMQTGYG